MPYADKEKQRKAVAENMRRYRERIAADPDYLAKEKERKAQWYAENKEKKAEAQRQYRARLREKKS